VVLRRLGFEALFITRVPQRTQHVLTRTQQLEGMWRRRATLPDEEHTLPDEEHGNARGEGGRGEESSTSRDDTDDEIFVHLPLTGSYAFPQETLYEGSSKAALHLHSSSISAPLKLD
jgi:hypothetical protein